MHSGEYSLGLVRDYFDHDIVTHIILPIYSWVRVQYSTQWDQCSPFFWTSGLPSRII